MLAWLNEHGALLQAAVGIVTALVWVIYLHIFVSGQKRQRRNEILITVAGQRDLTGHILVCNLGFEPVYILDILMKRCAGDDHTVFSVADRSEVRAEDQTSVDKVTLQMPLNSGDFVDVGPIETLLSRGDATGTDLSSREDLTRLELTVAAVSAATTSIVAARRVFELETSERGARILRPLSLYAEQIRDRRGRRAIERQLQAMI